MTADERAAAVAARQGGVISRAQAKDCGLTQRMIGYRVRSGRWQRAHQGVYTVAGLPPSWLTTVWVASLAAGDESAVSHQSALLLHGLSDRLVPRWPVTVMAPHGVNTQVTGAVVYQCRELPSQHLVRHRSGLLVTTPARAIVDVAGVVGVRHLGVLVDEVIVGRMASLAQISGCLRDVARRGKPGVGRLGEVLDDRLPGYVPPHSVLERELFEVLARGGLPAPKRQVPLPGRGAIEGLVDSAYPDVKVIIEADGRRWHTRVRDLASDHQRDAEAARVGWLTLRLLYEQIVGDPEGTCATVRDVREARRAALGDAA